MAARQTEEYLTEVRRVLAQNAESLAVKPDTAINV